MSYKLLAAKSLAISQQYPVTKTAEDIAWEGSPFDWFRKRASSTKGKIGRDLAESLLEAAGLGYERKGLLLEVDDKKIRMKTSLMWNAGGFTFEQIRETDFDFLLCLGLYPDSSYGWLIPKSELIIDGVARKREGLGGQHGGDADATDFWLKPVDPANVFTWLKPFGGTTDELIEIIKASL